MRRIFRHVLHVSIPLKPEMLATARRALAYGGAGTCVIMSKEEIIAPLGYTCARTICERCKCYAFRMIAIHRCTFVQCSRLFSVLSLKKKRERHSIMCAVLYRYMQITMINAPIILAHPRRRRAALKSALVAICKTMLLDSLR